MFNNCQNLRHIDMRNTDFSHVTNSSSMFYNVSSSCTIIVKDDTQRDILLGIKNTLKNIKTVAELEAEG